MKHIPLNPVHSSNIDGVGYDEQQSRLVVKFKSGGVYAYDHVPPDIHQGLVTAKSPGSYFHQKVKDKYSTTKLEQLPITLDDWNTDVSKMPTDCGIEVLRFYPEVFRANVDEEYVVEPPQMVRSYFTRVMFIPLAWRAKK